MHLDLETGVVTPVASVVLALGEAPRFRPGARIHVSTRFPVGRYRAALCLRGKAGVVEAVIEPRKPMAGTPEIGGSAIASLSP